MTCGKGYYEQTCDVCGHRLADPVECDLCHGDDPYGTRWCPECDYCCGC